MIAHVEDIRGPNPEDRKSYPIAYVVSFGELREGTDAIKLSDLQEADLVIIVRNGSFWVWKDRNGSHGPVSFDEAWDRIRQAAEDHVKYKRQSREQWMGIRAARKLRERGVKKCNALL
jgi:hypothetical protein